MDEIQFLALIAALLSQHSNDEVEQNVAKARAIIAAASEPEDAGDEEAGEGGEEGDEAGAPKKRARVRSRR